MCRFARKFARVFVVAFVLFGLFTTFVPCKYSSYRAVSERLGLITYAGASPYCDCNRGWSDDWGSGGCVVDSGCIQQSWGCGPFWMLDCNSCRDLSSCDNWV